MKTYLTIDSNGRVMLPKRFREEYLLTNLSKLNVARQGNSIILTPSDEIGFDPTHLVNEVSTLKNLVRQLRVKESMHLNLITELQRGFKDVNYMVNKLMKDDDRFPCDEVDIN